MTFEEKISFLKHKWEANKMAVISDAKNNKYICAINYNAVSKYFALSIEMHDTELNNKGFINIFRAPNNRLSLSSIYVYWDVRGLGLATKLNDLASFILRDEAGKIIRGRFFPYDVPQDTQLPTGLTNEEKEYFAKKFYQSNGYNLLKYDDFKSNPENFPELDKWDFELGEKPAEIIVIKKIKQLKNNQFQEHFGFITEIEPEEELEK